MGCLFDLLQPSLEVLSITCSVLFSIDNLRGLIRVSLLSLCGSSAECDSLLSFVFLLSLVVCGVNDGTFPSGVVGVKSILSSPSFSTAVDRTDLSETTVPSFNVLARL